MFTSKKKEADSQASEKDPFRLDYSMIKLKVVDDTKLQVDYFMMGGPEC